MATELRAIDADIPMGMTQIEDGDAKVLLVRDEAGLRAFQATCPHYGAPLAKGEICGHTLYCPWHKAAFDVSDGALIEPPALAGLARYPIRTEGDDVVVTLEAIKPDEPERSPDARTFVIVGTGAAAVSAATTLRREGFGGRILVVGRETGEPYDRPKLSKNFMAKQTEPSKMALEDGFYAKHDVELVKGPATGVDVATREVTLPDGAQLIGDALLIATGSRAVVPRFEGGRLANIFTLRGLADAVKISDAAEKARSIVVVGGGFIGLEVAAFLTKRGLKATVVSPEPLPLAARFGDTIAKALKAYHEGNGIRFIKGKVSRFDGEARVSAVWLEGGDRIATDLVLIGAGAAPETDCISGATKREDGGIEVDARLRIAPDVWLAGDIAAFPEHRSGQIARIEHWRLAEQQGAHVARAMLGSNAVFDVAPFFWSNQGDKRLDYAGYAPEWEDIVVDGNIEKLDFIAYYIRDGKAIAACAIGHNPQMIAFLHLLDEGRVPEPTRLATEDLSELV